MDSLGNTMVFAIVVFAVSMAVSVAPHIFAGARKHIHSMIAISTGIMMGILFLLILPEAMEEGGEHGFEPVAIMAVALVGYLAIFIVGVFVNKEGALKHNHSFTSMAAYVGLTIHAAFDGISLAAGFIAGTEVGIMMLVAICLHKSAEVFSLSSTLSLSMDRGKALKWMAGFSAVTPIVAIVAVLLLSGEAALIGPAMAFSAGVLMFVVFNDMVPEIFHGSDCEYRSRTALFVAGIVIVGLVWLAMTALTGGHGH